MSLSETSHLQSRARDLSRSKQALLNKWLGTKLSESSATGRIPKRPANFSILAPLSFSQQRLWLLEQLVPGSSVYHMHDAVRIQGDINIDVLSKALFSLVQRHEILRTSFVLVGAEPMQKISETSSFLLPVENLSNLPLSQREARALEIAIEETKRPFDFEQGPLFRARLIRISEKDQILLWTMHHIVSDGWSLGVIIKEVLAFCEAFNLGKPNPLRPLGLQYADFAIWQRGTLSQQAVERQLKFWKKELGGNIPQVDLPFDRPRPAVPSYAGGRYATLYPLELSKQLQKLALQENATLFMILLAAFDVLLYRYTSANKILVGVPVANRNEPELHDLIGYFSNTVVMKAELDDKLTYRTLLHQVRKTALAVYEHQDISFEQLVDELQPERLLNRTPFFQVMFVLQNEPMPSIDQETVHITPLDIHNGTSKFDLLLNIFETPEGLNVGFEYSTDLFNTETIQRFLGHYQTLLQDIVVRPDENIGKLKILTTQEEVELSVWNQTQVDYSEKRPWLLHHLFEKQVVLSPNAVAISFEGQTLTYRSLNERANQLAHYLMSYEIGVNSIVAIGMNRCIDLVIGLLAILKSGAAYVPLDLEYPAERLRYMLENSQAHLVLVSDFLPAVLDDFSGYVVSVQKEAEKIGLLSTENIAKNIAENDIAYVIYTSGSTGRPKGAMNTHGGICNRLLWMQDCYQLKSNDVVLQKTPFSFDVSVWEFFWPLITGAKLVLAPPGAHRDSAWLATIIQTESVTTVHFVPSMLRLFLSDSTALACQSLRRVICSGEALGCDIQEKFKICFSADLHNLYGPTEAAVDVTFWNCRTPWNSNLVPIGRPIANIQIYILDPMFNHVPIGVPGELYIAGVGVGLGYLHQPQLTAERFIENPFSKDGSSKLYKTGDLARFLKGGVIEFLGRIDHQVKLRGLRIELEEIEIALLKDEVVREAAVIVREDVPGDQKLVAYVVTDPEINADTLSTASSIEQVNSWQMVFDKAYIGSQEKHILRNFISWNSSYTNQPIPTAEMNEWLDKTLERVREKSPRRILEIGCGMGLLLFSLAENCELYVGTDISQIALNYIQNTLPRTPISVEKITLLQRPANDFSGLAELGSFDMVILNSVVQYFPDLSYLLHVIEQTLPLVREGGHIFLGDVRNFDLADAFYYERLVAQQQSLDSSDVLQKIEAARVSETELMLSPSLFHYMPTWNTEIRSVEIHLKRGHFQNEMTQYRYDVFLRKTENFYLDNETHSTEYMKAKGLKFSELSYSLTSLAQYLQDEKSPILVTNIPNARIFQTVQNLANFQQKSQTPRIDSKNNITVDPEYLYELYGNQFGVYLTWSKLMNHQFDAIFFPLHSSQTSRQTLIESMMSSNSLTKNLFEFANDPSKAKKERFLSHYFKESLKKQLPLYMVPDIFIFLKNLPLSLSGKLDRKKLPKPDTFLFKDKKNFVEPGTELEKKIAKIWKELLQIDLIGIDDSFFDFGGNSLLAAQMMLRLREVLSVEIPLRVLFQLPTIRGIVSSIERKDDMATTTANIVWTQMQKDSFLPPAIIASNKEVPQLHEKVLLTGATGFLGAYLLNSLIRKTQMTIYCLVRSKSPVEGLDRLKRALGRYQLIHDIDFGRVVVLSGYLEQINLGLGSDLFESLSKEIHAIYHAAATVNFISPYESLKAANVNGTLELLRLASIHHVKHFHFVSSIYTLTDQDRGEDPAISEQHLPQYGDKLKMGYLQSKWVSERLAEAARHRGITVNIYRPGRISGHSITGACQENDFFWGLVRVCLKLGYVPDQGLDESLLPVDYVSDAIINLSLEKNYANQNFHLFNEHILKTEEMLNALKKYGYTPMKLCSYPEWKSIALSHAKLNPDDDSSKLAGFLLQDDAMVEPTFTNKRTHEALQKIGIDASPVIHTDLLHRYFNYFVSEGFFHAPLS